MDDARTTIAISALMGRPLLTRWRLVYGSGLATEEAARVACARGVFREGQTSALSGTQQAPRSGNLLLRVRVEQPVMRASLSAHHTPPRTQRPLSSSAHSGLALAIAIFIGQPGAVSIRCSSDHARPKQSSGPNAFTRARASSSLTGLAIALSACS